MIDLVGSSGAVYENVDLDIAKIIAYERDNPKWSILDLFDSLDRVRFSDLDVLASFVVGFDGIAQWMDAGLSANDLALVVQNSRFLGFTPSSQEDAASPMPSV